MTYVYTVTEIKEHNQMALFGVPNRWSGEHFILIDRGSGDTEDLVVGDIVTPTQRGLQDPRLKGLEGAALEVVKLGITHKTVRLKIQGNSRTIRGYFDQDKVTSMQDINTHDLKFDAGKIRMSLLTCGVPFALEEIAAVLTYGAQKYEAGSWKTIAGAEERYEDAAMRHYIAMKKGEVYDTESGLRHAAHYACCILFCNELTKEEINLVANPISEENKRLKKEATGNA